MYIVYLDGKISINQDNDNSMGGILMKKLMISLTAAMMMVLCFAFAAAASAASLPQPEAQVLSMRGQITEINGDMVTVKDAQSEQSIALHIKWNTNIVKGADGKAVSLDKLRVGDKLTAYYSPIMTRSLPPQSRAFALVLGDGEHDGIYTKVGSVDRTENGTRILSANGDIFVTIPDAVNSEAKDLKPGSKVLVWYDFVALSMPGQATATKAVILH